MCWTNEKVGRYLPLDLGRRCPNEWSYGQSSKFNVMLLVLYVVLLTTAESKVLTDWYLRCLLMFPMRLWEN
jgi:hypothetical protein